MYQSIRRSSSSNSSSQSNRSQFAPPPIKVQAKQDTDIPANQQESSSQSSNNFVNIPTLRPDAPAAVEPQGLIKPFREGFQQETSETASYEGLNFVQRAYHAQMNSNNPGLPIQAKLTIGQPGDKYEQEADRVASQVVQQINSPGSTQSPQGQSVQRQELEEEELQAKPEITSLQRQELEEEELQAKFTLQRQEAIGGGEASTDLDTAINSARGGGQSLDAGLQRSMGQAMGADFSGVKVHTDSQSDQLNQSIQAKAFTTGQDVFFRQGAYQPGSREGQELIAHELTHVMQQGSASQIQRLSEEELDPEQKKEMEEEGGAFIQAKFQSLSQARTPLIQRAYTARRPLGGVVRGIGRMSRSGVIKNKGIFHEHIFFEDGGDPANIGFMGKGGLGQDNATNYTVGHGRRNLDDAVMRQAVDVVGDPGKYKILGNNCQKYVEQVYKKYIQLGGSPGK
jgi:hypothetical protein